MSKKLAEAFLFLNINIDFIIYFFMYFKFMLFVQQKKYFQFMEIERIW